MKLVIEIPNEVVDKESYVDYFGCFSSELYEIIKNGTPLNEVLDEIRAEIDDMEEGISSYFNDRPWVFKDEVLKIIDKYRKEQENDNI